MYNVEIKMNNIQQTTVSMRLDIDEFRKLKRALGEGGILERNEYVTLECSDKFNTIVILEVARISVCIAQEDTNDD